MHPPPAIIAGSARNHDDCARNPPTFTHRAHLRLDRLRLRQPGSPLFLILTSRPPPPLPCSSFPPSPFFPANRAPPILYSYLFFDPIAFLPSPQPPVSTVRPPSVPQVRSPLGKWAVAEAQEGGGERGETASSPVHTSRTDTLGGKGVEGRKRRAGKRRKHSAGNTEH